jgi:type IV pilus assembly protein PilY1
MAGIKGKLLSVATALILATGLPVAASAADISDYTSFPPFLPRVVSPNILFLLDYSYSMVRPAYGVCTSIADVAGTSATSAADYQSDCRYKYSHLTDDYDSTIPYAGYFNNGYTEEGAYSDAAAIKYTWSSSEFVKSASGSWNGNWLNWLTMTQFDILKKVAVGGDMDPAPEGANPSNMKLRSILRKSPMSAGLGYMKVVKAAEIDKCSDRSADCTAWPTISYNWVSTPNSGVTTVFGNADADDALSSAQSLPFYFTLYGNTYSQVYISTNGWLSFSSPGGSAPNNLDLPNAGAPANLIAPWWDDLRVFIEKSSTVKTFTTGSAPDRQFVVSFENMIHADDSGKANPISFQVILYEGSNHIVFQYNNTQSGRSESFGQGRSATVGVANSDGTRAKKYLYGTGGSSYNGTLLSDGLALFAAPHISYLISNTASPTDFGPAAPLSATKTVKIAINEVASCPPEPASYKNTTTNKCYDHETMGLLQDFRDGELAGQLGFRLAIMQLNDEDGARVTKHFNQKDTGSTWSSLMTETRGQKPTDKTPLAEALHLAQGYFRQDASYNLGLTPSNSWTNNGTGADCNTTTNTYDPFCFQSAAQKVPCAKSFVLLVSSGYYSHDVRRNIYNDELLFADKTLVGGSWKSTDDSGSEGTKANRGWLDNVAYQTHTTDLRTDDPLDAGDQTVGLYVVNTYGEGTGDGTEVLKKAALYGGFKDANGNQAFDSGEDDPSSPRTYFAPSGSEGVKTKVVAAVTEILKNSASGTSVSVLSTSAGGEGALYQAYFYPAKLEGETEDRRWPGYLRAFFLDRYQNLRDDFSNTSSSGTGAPDHRLVLAEDRVIRMYLSSDNEVKLDLFHDSDGVFTGLPTAEVTLAMDQVPSIWEAGNKLALRDKADRTIYLWLDGNNDGAVQGGDFNVASTTSYTAGVEEALEFKNTATLQTLLKPYLRTADTVYTAVTIKSAEAEAGEVIDYIRGLSVDGYRPRCIALSGGSGDDNCGTGKRSWPLGDIVYSTPTLVAAPGEKFDAIYADTSYRAFTQKYKNRRQVVYVGANDGLLHAFNAGVYHSGDDTSASAPTGKTETGWFTDGPSSGDNWNVGLGDELWSFLPHDNLPHLAWLACNGNNLNTSDTTQPFDPSVCGSAEYTHVNYVDHRPKVTDVRIFTDDAAHPGGWGTILILPMRLGGGAIDVTANFSSPYDAAAPSTTRQFRSAYYVFDITDPEEPPKLLWRFSHGELGFTTSYPAIARIKDASNVVKWYMVVGSGPKNATGTNGRDYGLTTASTQAGKIFVVDLEDGSLDNTFTVDANTIMGDPTVVDADLDFSADIIYIGSAISAYVGKVYRINTNKSLASGWTRSTLFDPDPNQSSTDPDDATAGVPKDMGPLLVGPSVSKDIFGNLWVFFGTGRLKNTDDLLRSDQQRFYGIKDKCWKGTSETGCPSGTEHVYTWDNLLNTSGVKVTSVTGSATQVTDSTTGYEACDGAAAGCSYQTLLAAARAKSGWYINLDNDNSSPELPSEQVLSRSSILGGLLLFTTYKPTSDLCSVLGDSALYALYYETGTAYNKPVVGTTYDTVAGKTYVNKTYDLGQGMPTSVGVAIGETVSGFVQKSTGEIVRVEAAPGLGVRSGTATWRESSGGGTVEIETIYKHIVK